MVQHDSIVDEIPGLTPGAQPARGWFRHSREEFQRMRIKTITDLLTRYNSFSAHAKFVAIILFMRYRYRRAIPLLLGELEEGSPTLAGAAGPALAMIGGDYVLRRLVRLLGQRGPELRRIALIGAVAMVCDVRHVNLLAGTLVTILDNNAEPATCRMSAAEGLANALARSDKRTKLYNNTVRALRTALADISPDIRAGAAFALGQLRDKRSLALLMHVARHDHSRCRMHAGHPKGWTVSNEAKEAISAIKGRRVD
jgi:hypothetical protein